MMPLDTALKGMLDAESALRTPEGVANPAILSENMQRLSQYAGAVEEHLAAFERDYEIMYHDTLRRYMEAMKVSQAEREADIQMADLKGQIKYLSRLVASAWKQTSVAQSRINHLVKEAETTNL